MQKLLSLKNYNVTSVAQLIFISILLSIPAIMLGNYLLFIIPIIFVITLSYLIGEKFIMFFILLTLFTLVGELSSTLRAFVHFIDFTLLGIMFLKRYGLEFNTYRPIPNSIKYFVLLYFSAMVISAVMSKYPSASIEVILRQGVFLSIAYVFFALIKDESDITAYFKVIVIVTCIVITVFLISFIESGYDLIKLISKDRVRVTGITANIEAATNFIVVSFPILLTGLLFNSHRFKKILFWFLIIFLTIGLMLAMSRSAIIGIIFSSAIIFFVLRRKLFYRLILYLGIALCVYLFVEPITETVNLLFRFEEGLSTRDYLWSMSLNLIKDHPVFGIGPGVYKYEMFNYLPFMLNDWYGRLYILFFELTSGGNMSHNLFLVFFTEMGILGAITILVLPFLFISIGVRAIINSKNVSKKNYYLAVALFAAGCSIIIRNLINSIGILYVGGIHTDLPFWLIFGSLVFLNNFSIRNSSESLT